MAKGIFVGIGGKARKVKKIYVGIGGKARKVKKAYVGIAGKARLFWSGGEVSYYGTVTALSRARSGLTGGYIENYALFAGGTTNINTGEFYNTVDAYNVSLVRSVSQMGSSQAGSAFARIGEYALFAGGYYRTSSSGSTPYSSVDALNANLTRSSAAELNRGKMYLAGASNNTYAIFAGGYVKNVTGSFAYVGSTDAYNSSLVRTSSSRNALQEIKDNLAGASVGNYALFAGGSNGSGHLDSVDAFNGSLTRTIVSTLGEKKYGMAGISIGDYAVFAGGVGNKNQSTKSVEAYNQSLVKTVLSDLPAAGSPVSSKAGQYALFALGSNLHLYNEKLVSVPSIAFAFSRYSFAGAYTGKYALFAGGNYGGTHYSRVDVYTA